MAEREDVDIVFSADSLSTEGTTSLDDETETSIESIIVENVNTSDDDSLQEVKTEYVDEKVETSEDDDSFGTQSQEEQIELGKERETLDEKDMVDEEKKVLGVVPGDDFRRMTQRETKKKAAARDDKYKISEPSKKKEGLVKQGCGACLSCLKTCVPCLFSSQETKPHTERLPPNTLRPRADVISDQEKVMKALEMKEKKKKEREKGEIEEEEEEFPPIEEVEEQDGELPPVEEAEEQDGEGEEEDGE